MINTGGELSAYFSILTSFKLLPYILSTDINKQQALQILHPKFNIDKLIEICPLNQIWLIMLDERNKDETECVGYIGINNDNYIITTITPSYQQRGIATSMIAKVIEIYKSRIFPKNEVIKLYKLNLAITAIAKKLHFIENSDSTKIYERNVSIKNRPITIDTITIMNIII